MKVILYFTEGILQIILGVLSIVYAVLYSEKLGKVMNLVSGAGFVVLGVLNCILGSRVTDRERERKIYDESIGN